MTIARFGRGRPAATSRAGVFDRGQQAGAQTDRVVERLQRQGVLVDAGDAETRRDRAGGDHEVVVVERDLVVDGDRPAVEVDRGHGAEQEPRRLRPAQDAAHGEADVAGVETRRRHLVQQRLEGVEVVGVDDGDVDRRATQSLDDAQPAEPRPDDDDMRFPCHEITLRAKAGVWHPKGA